jgi:hypothetical protein
LDHGRRREGVKTSIRATLSMAVTGREEGVNGNRNQQNSLFNDGTRQGENWGGDPASHPSGFGKVLSRPLVGRN